MSTRREAALPFIFITMLVDVIGFGIIIPVIPKLISQLANCDMSTAARYGGWMTFTYAFMQFICAPILGGLSDQYGRRPVILASLFAFGIDFIILGLSTSLPWLFIARIVSGITGASFTSANAYIADITPPEKRAQSFGLVGVAFGVGFIIGPLLGGLLSTYGLRVPFFAAAGLALLNWLYGYFILPESLKPENRRPFSWKRANPIGSVMHLSKYKAVLGMIASLILIYIAGHANQSTWTYITMEKYGWTEKMVGISLALVGLGVAIVQGGLTRVVIPKFGQKNSIILGLGLYTFGFTLMAFASTGTILMIFFIPFVLGGIAGPALQGYISSHVPSNEQGELSGALTGLISLTSIIGPLLMTNLFSFTSKHDGSFYFPGSPFILGAVLSLISMILAWYELGWTKKAHR